MTFPSLGHSALLKKRVRQHGYNHQKSAFLEAAHVLMPLELTLLPRPSL